MTITEKQDIDEWCEARTISILATHLPAQLREQLLARIRQFRNIPARVQGLNGISNAFPEPLAGEIRDEAFVTVQSIENHWLRSRAFATPCSDIETLVNDLLREYGPNASLAVLPAGPLSVPYLQESIQL